MEYRQKGTLVLIVVFLVAQSYFPVRYYLGFTNRYDERFCWRMFSPIRQLQSCKVNFFWKNETLIKLEGIYRPTWTSLLSMCREEVIEAVSHDLCNSLGGSPSNQILRKVDYLDRLDSNLNIHSSPQPVC